MKKRVAFIISRLLGPLPLLCLLWLVTAIKSGIGFWRALWVYPLIFLVGIGLPFGISFLIILKRKTTFEWKNIRDRIIYFPIFLIFWVIGAILIRQLTSPTIYHLAQLAGLLTIIIYLIMAVFRFKISIHMAIAGGVFWGINFLAHGYFWWLFCLLPIIAWARYELKVHSVKELLTGLILSNGLILLALFIFGWPGVP